MNAPTSGCNEAAHRRGQSGTFTGLRFHFDNFNLTIYVSFIHRLQILECLLYVATSFLFGDEVPARVATGHGEQSDIDGAHQSLILTALMNNAAEAADGAHLAVKLKGRAAVI